MAIKLIKK